MKSTFTGILAMFVVGLMPMIGLADWDTKEEAERGCVCASRYGVEDKCYVCKGVGYLKRVKYGHLPNGGMGRRPRKEYYVQCSYCLKKKDKWESLKQERERRQADARRAQLLEIAEEKRRWNEELAKKKRLEEEERTKERERIAEERKKLEDAFAEVRKAKDELEVAKRVGDSMYPERLCEIHKWKECYAPIFGGDYYTEDAKAKYAQNYMKSLELQNKGLLKCTCHDSEHWKNWRYLMSEVNDAEKKLEDAKKRSKEVYEKLYGKSQDE